MKNRIIIIGAGGHGKVVADIALKNGYTEIFFLDDNAKGMCMEFPVVGRTCDVNKLNDGKTDFVIAVGNNKIRRKIAESYSVQWITLIHPSAQIAAGVSIGVGTAIMAGSVVNPCAIIGKRCILNSGAIVEHDNVLGDYVHVSPGASLGGTVRIGTETHIGIGAVVKNNVSVCEDCIIGAGAVVVQNIFFGGGIHGYTSRYAKGKIKDVITVFMSQERMWHKYV